MKVIAALLVGVALASASSIDSKIVSAFDVFYEKYNKEAEYARGSEEFFLRLANFADNMEVAAKMNNDHMLAHGHAVFGMNSLSDLSEAEFQSKLMVLTAEDLAEYETVERVELGETEENDIDWRTRGVLTPVKNQEQCGSCWAFSATEAIESFAKLAGDELAELSPQQIVSCDKTDGGCNGGWPYKAFEYVRGAGGMETNADYPYTSGRGQTGVCKVDTSKFVSDIHVKGHVNVQQGESNLASALAKGPVSIAVDASSWSRYSGGVLSSCGRSVDHAVQAVGMTSSYWIVRNSWGTGWGEQGFIRIARGSDLCLISDYVSYPTF